MLQPVLLLFRFAHALGGTGGNQRRKTGRRASPMRLAGPLHGLPETPLEKQTHGILEYLPGLIALATGTIVADPLRQPEGRQGHAHRRVEGQEKPKQEKGKQIQRNLDTPWRYHEQQVTVVQAGTKGDRNRHREEGNDPEQPSHRLSLPWRRLRNAAWVSFKFGSSTLISAADIWRNVDWADATALSLVSKYLPSHSWATFSSLR